jgi:hypothetical protein
VVVGLLGKHSSISLPLRCPISYRLYLNVCHTTVGVGVRPAGDAGEGEPLCGYDAEGEVGAVLRDQAAQQQPIVAARCSDFDDMEFALEDATW